MCTCIKKLQHSFLFEKFVMFYLSKIIHILTVAQVYRHNQLHKSTHFLAGMNHCFHKKVVHFCAKNLPVHCAKQLFTKFCAVKRVFKCTFSFTKKAKS